MGKNFKNKKRVMARMRDSLLKLVELDALVENLGKIFLGLLRKLLVKTLLWLRKFFKTL